MMQIDLYCPDCLAELAAQGKDKLENMKPLLSDIHELHNDGMYIVHCPKGHNGKVILRNLNFELLFDLGINAIIDGYYRDAVTSIASSLERFYEFFVKTSWRIKGAAFDVIDKNWEKLSSQSERQLGAYIASYCMLFGASSPILSNNDKNFRNNVVHKGEIPDRDRTVSFVSSVLKLIDDSLQMLQSSHMDILRETYEQYLPKYNSIDEKENILTINHPTIICAEEELEKADKRKCRDIDYLVNLVMQDRHNKQLRLFEKGTGQALL